jgi:hypothetical protein
MRVRPLWYHLKMIYCIQRCSGACPLAIFGHLREVIEINSMKFVFLEAIINYIARTENQSH